MLKYIEFENHYKIGNLKLNFGKNENEAFKTIVLVGENGTGKTSILEALSGFQKGGYLNDFSNVKKVVYFDKYGTEHTVLKDEEKKRFSRPQFLSDGDLDAMCEYTEENYYKERRELSEALPCDVRNSRIVFSEARSGFEVDLSHQDKFSDYEKKGSDYTGFVKLLIDLENMDNDDYLAYAKSHLSCTYDKYMSEKSRIERFKKAFENMLDGFKYIGRNLKYQDETVYFEKNGKQIDINELSTGEKQIVFRGIDLLYHAEPGATVIIDEPELSLHPKWQKKILDFYRSLLMDENGEQMAQLIVATHSPYIVQSAIEDSKGMKVILLENDGTSATQIKLEDFAFDMHSAAEVNYLVFGVDAEAYHIELFGALHGLLQQKKEPGVNSKIKSVDLYIKRHAYYDDSLHRNRDTGHGDYRDGDVTICVYIRNAIDHPDVNRHYSSEDIKNSIDLLRRIYISKKQET